MLFPSRQSQGSTTDEPLNITILLNQTDSHAGINWKMLKAKQDKANKKEVSQIA